MKLLKEESLFVIALAFLSLFMAGVVFISLNIQTNNVLLLLKSGMRLIANQLLVQVRNDTPLVAPPGPSDVTGIGLYRSDGTRLQSLGNAPAALVPDSAESFTIDYERQLSRLIIKKNQPVPPDDPAVAFIEINTREQLARITLLRVISTAGPAVIIVLMLIFVFLYRRNLSYRKKIAAQQELVRLGEAARMLSHEIKNPLGAIRLQTAYLRRTGSGDAEKSIGIIEEEVERLSGLSRRMADFLKDPSGSAEEIDVGRFVARCAERFQYPIRINKNEAADFRITADPERFRSVLENILRNAIESMEPECAPGKPAAAGATPVEAFLRAERGYVKIEICDRGPGIDEKNAARLFDPFFTTKAQGSGLGLFIARRFTEAIGGKITVGNREGGGARVTLSFPLRKKT